MALGVINDVLFLKMKTVFASVIDKADIANDYIVIDRTSSKSPAAEYLIEMAMEQTQMRPTIVIVDSKDRLENFTKAGCKEAQSCLDQMEKVREAGKIFGT